MIIELGPKTEKSFDALYYSGPHNYTSKRVFAASMLLSGLNAFKTHIVPLGDACMAELFSGAPEPPAGATIIRFPGGETV